MGTGMERKNHETRYGHIREPGASSALQPPIIWSADMCGICCDCRVYQSPGIRSLKVNEQVRVNAGQSIIEREKQQAKSKARHTP